MEKEKIDYKLLTQQFDEMLENMSDEEFFKWLEEYKKKEQNNENH